MIRSGILNFRHGFKAPWGLIGAIDIPLLLGIVTNTSIKRQIGSIVNLLGVHSIILMARITSSVKARFLASSSRERASNKSSLDSELDHLLVSRVDLYNVCRQAAESLLIHFGNPRDGTTLFKIKKCLIRICLRAPLLAAYAAKIEPQIPLFDFSSSVPGNGYRSILAVLDTCVIRLIHLMWKIDKERTYMLFKARQHCKELDAFATILDTCGFGLTHSDEFLQISTPPNLFPEGSDELLNDLMRRTESLNQECFYGRAVGFQFCASLTPTLKTIGIALSSFSDAFESRPTQPGLLRATIALMSSGKYIMSPEKRAQRIVRVTRDGTIHFCKAFWSVTEHSFVSTLTTHSCPPLAVNECFSIPMGDAIELESRDYESFGPSVLVNPPGSPPDEIAVRLLSWTRREGMQLRSCRVESGAPTDVAKLSPYLLFHCHGGGFVAQSSRSHEVYLRSWAQCLDVPILSVDYKLAPEYPYPFAQKEVVYAYAWALTNACRLGWTGESIVMAGDSAGGNLLISSSLRLIDLGVKRLPDGLVPIYGAFLVRYIPSPSRFLSLMDPLLPLGIVARCMAAYTGNSDEFDHPRWPKLSALRKLKKGNSQTLPNLSLKATSTKSKIYRTDPDENENGSVPIGKLDNAEDFEQVSAFVNFHLPVEPVLPDQDLLKTPDFEDAREAMEWDNTEPAPMHEVSACDIQNCAAYENGDTFEANSVNLSHVSRAVKHSSQDAQNSLGIRGHNHPNTDNTGAGVSAGVDNCNDSVPGVVVDSAEINGGHDVLKRAPVGDRSPSEISSASTSSESGEHENDHAMLEERPSLIEIHANPSVIVLSVEGYDVEFVQHLRELLANSSPTLPHAVLTLNGTAVIEANENCPPPSHSSSVPTLAIGAKVTRVMLGKKSPATGQVASPPKTMESRPMNILDSVVSGFSETIADGIHLLTSDVDYSRGSDHGCTLPEGGFYAYGGHPANPVAVPGGPEPGYHSVNNRQSRLESFVTTATSGELYEPKRPVGMAADVLHRRRSSLDSLRHSSAEYPLGDFCNMKIPKDPFLSPIYAPDTMLKLLPPVFMVGCHLDPLLDDTVVLGRRLKEVGAVVELELLDSLPHGFLCFVMVSPECQAASEICQSKIRKAFGMAESV